MVKMGNENLAARPVYQKDKSLFVCHSRSSGHCGLSAILPTCSESEERFQTSWNDKI